MHLHGPCQGEKDAAHTVKWAVSPARAQFQTSPPHRTARHVLSAAVSGRAGQSAHRAGPASSMGQNMATSTSHERSECESGGGYQPMRMVAAHGNGRPRSAAVGSNTCGRGGRVWERGPDLWMASSGLLPQWVPKRARAQHGRMEIRAAQDPLHDNRIPTCLSSKLMESGRVPQPLSTPLHCSVPSPPLCAYHTTGPHERTEPCRRLRFLSTDPGLPIQLPRPTRYSASPVTLPPAPPRLAPCDHPCRPAAPGTPLPSPSPVSAASRRHGGGSFHCKAGGKQSGGGGYSSQHRPRAFSCHWPTGAGRGGGVSERGPTPPQSTNSQGCSRWRRVGTPGRRAGGWAAARMRCP